MRGRRLLTTARQFRVTNYSKPNWFDRPLLWSLSILIARECVIMKVKQKWSVYAVTCTEDFPDCYTVRPDVCLLVIDPLLPFQQSQLLRGHPFDRDPLLEHQVHCIIIKWIVWTTTSGLWYQYESKCLRQDIKLTSLVSMGWFMFGENIYTLSPRKH